MDGFGVGATLALGATDSAALGAADGGVDSSAVDGAADVPARPHAARKTAKPAMALPCTNRRRDRWRSGVGGVSFTGAPPGSVSVSVSIGRGGFEGRLVRHDERVVR